MKKKKSQNAAGKMQKIKPKYTDYLKITATRFLPVTPKIRRKLRFRLLKQKEDINIYENKEIILLQVLVAAGLGELLYSGLAFISGFYLWNATFAVSISGLLLEYICFLITMPIGASLFYPFTNFVVRFPKEIKEK